MWMVRRAMGSCAGSAEIANQVIPARLPKLVDGWLACQ
jgi:hypothetical protein